MIYLLTGIGVLVVYLAAVWYGQRLMLFPAAWLPSPVGDPRAQLVTLETTPDELHALFPGATRRYS